MSVSNGDPWFQDLFAERIGGSGYGKGSEIYKFEKIKRAKRAALQAHPERACLTSASARTTTWPTPWSARRSSARSTSWKTADTPTTASRRSRRRRPVHAAGLRRHTRPGHRGQPRHRLQAGPGHAAGRLHQPGRRDPDDRARLPGGRHPHQLLWRRGLQAAAAEENGFYPDLAAIPADVRAGPSCWSSTIPTARPGRWPRAIFTAR